MANNNQTVHEMLAEEADFIKGNIKPHETATRSRLGGTINGVYMTIQITSSLVPDEVNG